jgi:cell division protease FtsH
MQFPPNNKKDPAPTPPDGENKPPQFQVPRWAWIAVVAVLGLWFLLRFTDTSGSNVPGTIYPVTYTFFREQLAAGNIESVTMQEAQVVGELTAAREYPADGSPELQQGAQQAEVRYFSTTLLPVDDPTLTQELIAQGVEVEARTTEINPILLFLFNWGPLILLLGFFLWTSRRAQRQMTGVFGFGRTQAREYNAEKPKVTFLDVAGQEAAKSELVEIVDFLKEPDKYIALGARIPRGVLLVGPPGTGKTLLARAVAGEANVAFFSITASEFVEMFVGVGASRVRDLFSKAKAAAPAIVFIDEIDAVGRQRGAGLGGGNDEREQTLNQMLAEMDGFDRTESVIVMAATNRPDVLDPALLRPGRFDRQITVALPDRRGRHDILKVHTRGKPIGDDVNLEQMAKATIGFSGADLANLTNEAALTAARKSRKRIITKDFLEALDRIILGTQSPPLSNENERRVVAYHEAGHALVAALTPGADPVLKVTIVPRGQALGVTASMPDDDRRNYSRGYLNAQLHVLLGGRAAEEVAIGEITTGASNDLQRVTSLARRMVASFGMSDAIGPINFGEDERQPFLGYSLSQGRNYSEATAARIDSEVRHIVEAAHQKTVELLRENKDKLDALAHELLTNEIVEGARVAEIAGVPVHENQVPLQPIEPVVAGD